MLAFPSCDSGQSPCGTGFPVNERRPGPAATLDFATLGFATRVVAALGLAWAMPLAGPPAAGQAPAPPARPATAETKTKDAEGPPAPQRVRLATSDGVQLALWYYAVQAADDAAGEKPPVALLVHDLDGSHVALEPLARALQARRIAAVVPDLRGHGESVSRTPSAGAAERLESRQLKKPDFEAMTRTSGGRVRDQATVRGDLETVRGWIKRQGEAGAVDFDRLFVVGSGLGGALALTWAVEDAKWPPIATGAQGRQVRGIALVSPTWTTRGFSIAPALADDLIRRGLPLLLIAGTEDRDTVKLFEQLKRQRPTEWYDKRVNQPPESGSKDGATPPTLYLLQLNTPLEGDRLAAWIDAGGRGGDPAALIAGFMAKVGAKPAD